MFSTSKEPTRKGSALIFLATSRKSRRCVATARVTCTAARAVPAWATPRVSVTQGSAEQASTARVRVPQASAEQASVARVRVPQASVALRRVGRRQLAAPA